MRANPYYLTGLTTALSNTDNKLQNLTNQLSSGVRVNSLSDDPAAAAQNEQILAQLSKDVTFSQTASLTEGLLNVGDSALGSVVSQITKAISVATEGNNGTLNASNQKAVAEELTGIRDEILSIANTTYSGQYIFAGSNTSQQPFTLSAGVVTYNGNSSAMTVQTPTGQSIDINIAGNNIFGTTSGVLATLNLLIGQFNSGTASSTSSAISSNITDLTTELNQVSANRVTLDNSLSRVQSAATYATSEATQLTAAQTNLMQADLTSLSSQLKLIESQQTAESSVFATLAQHNLFEYLK